MPHILIVEDDASARAALGELVSAEGFTTAQAGSLRDARIQISRHSPDAVLIDLVLPDGNGMDLMEDIPSHSGTEIIVMTGHASVETAVEALRMGAADYLVKPVNFQRLKSILARIPRPGDLKAEIGNLRGELRRLGLFGQMLGNSPAMQTLYDQVSRVAPTEATVLLIGESGTGKELAAQTIHDLSLRRKQPFLPVNCGAISPNLIESEMFGHERGSFTGADRQHKGYFERANGGTLLLDEITEMPVELQVKLLRVLETGVFMRVGTNREIDTDVRVIAATNRDPEEAVADGKLRADLYHRLNVFPLQLPPLRERGKDVELLAQHFLDQLNAQNNSKKTFLPQAMDTLRAYNWPGNVRELRNYVQRAYIMADDTGISTEAVPLQISTTQASSGSTLTIPVGTSLASADKKIILATLEQCGGVKKRAAELLGISLKTLYNRLEEYGNGSNGSNSNSEGENGKAQTTEA
ncbi:response regulator (plasmid) [Ralstonia syzygii]|uniref:Response regulator n=1 Tax=Ralstonia syzygii TaxID=28097 RepID=A0ABX7ZMB0_9RALS|nr:sigma-54 dependent transcriptional regulator [Ralstonia syzygii]QUP56351.1 response regulator [Ralstonia syzygii]